MVLPFITDKINPLEAWILKTCLFIIFLISSAEETFPQDFSTKSEANASDILEMFHLYYMHSNLLGMFKSSATH